MSGYPVLIVTHNLRKDKEEAMIAIENKRIIQANDLDLRMSFGFSHFI